MEIPPRVRLIRGWYQTRKGNQWSFGMKAHIGVDSATKVIHTVVATAANVADCTILPDLLHGDDTRVWGDQAYRGQHEAIRAVIPAARDFTNRRCKHSRVVDEVEKGKNRTKSRVRAGLAGGDARCGDNTKGHSLWPLV